MPRACILVCYCKVAEERQLVRKIAAKAEQGNAAQSLAEGGPCAYTIHLSDLLILHERHGPERSRLP